jgi:glycosyltransferase involved in cell wall biosynthesis
VFLPIYNKENYLAKVIENLQNQTLKDIEIVALNDCSNDSSLEILNNLSKKDQRIKIINNDKNHGLLYSRAMGILNCSGEYLMNLDPDDEIKGEDSLEYLYKQSKYLDLDIISFNALDKKSNSIIKCIGKNIMYKQPDLFYSLFNRNNVIREYAIWNKLIKKEIYLSAYEDFKDEIYNGKWNYFEDDIWNILVNRFAKLKACTPKLIYIYNNNQDSLMANRFSLIEFKNLLYRHEMYIKLFNTKENEKYLISEYFFLFNRLKEQLIYLLLLNEHNLIKKIEKIFVSFLNDYNLSNKEKNDLNNFLKMINYINRNKFF